jgi:hypothetical protein
VRVQRGERHRSRGASKRPSFANAISLFSSPPGLTRWSMHTRGFESQPETMNKPRRRMDCRIKSGNDEEEKPAQ